MITSPFDLEGLLLGSSTTSLENSLSDQAETIEERTTIDLRDFICMGDTCSFYSPVGVVDESSLNEVLLGKNQNLLGFFRFRRNSSLRPSMRELCLARKLRKSVHGDFGSNPFLIGLFTHSDSTKVHSIDYKLFEITDFGEEIKFSLLDIQLTNILASSQGEYQSFKPISSSTPRSMG